jgi:hypothetical protein
MKKLKLLGERANESLEDFKIIPKKNFRWQDRAPHWENHVNQVRVRNNARARHRYGDKQDTSDRTRREHTTGFSSG